jgi:hypothetical protein
MKRSLLVSVFMAAFGVAALLPSASSASGWLRRGCGGCDNCPAPCPVVAAPPAKVEVKYEDRVVTRYKPVTREKEIEVCVHKMVPREVKQTVMVPFTVKELRKVTECIPSYREVEYHYTEMVPRIIREKVNQTVTERRIKEVEVTVPVCRIVQTPCVDECGRCYTKCERVTEMQRTKRCVVECVPVVREVEVCRTVCDRVERVGKRTVCDMQRREKEVEVCVIRCQPQERICKVYECVPEKVKRKVQYCEMVPYQETIRVAVCPPPCSTACDTGCGHHRVFGGLFQRHGCCN